MKWYDLKYLLAYLGPLTAYISVFGSGIWCYSAVITGFIIIPVLDILIPISTANNSAHKSRATSKYFDILLYFNIPIVYGLLACFFIRVSSGILSAYEITGMLCGVGLYISTSGVNVAHELGHRSNNADRFLAKILLLPGLYLHYYIAHNRGHHKTVGTSQDPSTARYGETFYRFCGRSAIGEFNAAWKLEFKRLSKIELPLISLNNQMIVFCFLQMLFLVAVFILWGIQAVVYAFIISLVSNIIVQATNYIEHYGLIRKEKAGGGVEKVHFAHSWSSSHALGRIFLYELTRHSDHHYKASKKYQLLEDPDDCPQLPTGYPGSMIIALIPPLWFKIMHKRIPKEMVVIAQSKSQLSTEIAY